VQSYPFIQRKAILFWLTRLAVEYLSKVHNGVSCDSKCQLGLAFTGTFQGDDDEGTRNPESLLGPRAKIGYRGENENRQAPDRRDGFRADLPTNVPTREKVAEDPLSAIMTVSP